MAVDNEAYCTLLTTDAYLPGAIVLAHSLRDNGTKKKLAILVTLDSISVSTIDELKKVYDQIIPVERIVNRSPANLYLMNRPDLGSTFTKIALWRLTQFSHIVYIDADVVTLRAPDELFRQTASFAAAPDVGWPDCFNSGVLSLKPNMADYYALTALADRGISFDGADQGLLNMHFREWERLSFTYNCTPSGNYQYVPAYRHFQSSISVIHFIGHDKPWIMGRGFKGATGVYGELLGRWWAVYDRHFRYATSAFISGQAPKDPKIVQQYVTGEAITADFGFSSIGDSREKRVEVPEEHIEEPAPQIEVTESLPHEREEVDEGLVEAPPAVEQRRYSVDWDPAHQPPPIGSRAEAADLRTENYEMSQDPHLFRAPKYPEPPKDMYYSVPETPRQVEARPPPIFPWEATAPAPTRVFLEDVPPPAPAPVPELSVATPSATTDTDDDESRVSPTTPDIPQSPPESFERFSRTNAWDEDPKISRYISTLPQNRRAKIQVLLHNTGVINQPLTSPPIPEVDPTSQSSNLSATLRLTDFPTEIERPSLPVTPAPVRRPSFWDNERDEAGKLPGAEGVPDQSAWDPQEKLIELARRQSEVLERGEITASSIGLGSADSIPEREGVESASVPPNTEAATLTSQPPASSLAATVEEETGTRNQVVPLTADPSLVSDIVIASATPTTAQDTATDPAASSSLSAATAAATSTEA